MARCLVRKNLLLKKDGSADWTVDFVTLEYCIKSTPIIPCIVGNFEEFCFPPLDRAYGC